MYFNFFGTIQYNDSIIADLSKRITSQEIQRPLFLYDEYVIQDGERPDTVSSKFYNHAYYHWIILATNDLTLKTWPKSDATMDLYLEDKYGDNSQFATSHYLNSSGDVVPYNFKKSIEVKGEGEQGFYFNGDGLGVVQGDEVFFPNNPVTFEQYEAEQNDKKKTIRILDKRFIPNVVDLTRRLLNERGLKY